MKRAAWVEWHQTNAARVTHYQKSGDGTGGGCDCIGLSVGAWRLAGNKWPWTHGSNYAARYLTADDVQKDAPLRAGDWVFKAHKPGDKNYDLPARYKDHPDQNDYYHVGIVIQTDPLIIMHCTTVPGGIKQDNSRGSWHWSALFKGIEEDTMPDAGSKAIVTAEHGTTVNMRKQPSATSQLITAVPVGTVVDVIGNGSNGWSQIRYKTKEGWMMSRFLVPQEDPGNDVLQMLEEARQHLNEADTLVAKAMGVIQNG